MYLILDFGSMYTGLFFQAGPANSTQCANLSILDDSVLEGVEVFPGALQLTTNDQSGAIVLNPSSADLTILDNDSMSYAHSSQKQLSLTDEILSIFLQM